MSTSVKHAVVDCRAMVNTQIMDAARYRPPKLQNDPSAVAWTPEVVAALERYHRAVEAGMSPRPGCGLRVPGDRGRPLLRLTYPVYAPMIEARMAALVHGRDSADLRALAEA